MTISDYFKNYNFLFDSHAHLSTGGFDNDYTEVVQRAKDNGIEKIFDMAVDLVSSKKAIERAKTNELISAFVGIDPEVFEPGSEMFIGLDIQDDWFDEQYEGLRDLVSSINYELKPLAGIGESGMDFYHFKDQMPDIREQSTNLQKKLFIKHLELAEEFQLPLSIHSRAAEKECLEIVKSFPNTFGIFHSYTGDYETAKKILDAGWGLGVNGIITFKNAQPLREIYRKILGRNSYIGGIPHQAPEKLNPQYFYSKGIFFETDSPYLSPEGKRGDRNEPANVKIVCESFTKMLQE